MPMNTSGFQSSTRSRNARRSFSRRGRCDSTSARPITASSLRVVPGVEPGRAHRVAADAGELAHRGSACRSSFDQAGAEQVAGGFAGAPGRCAGAVIAASRGWRPIGQGRRCTRMSAITMRSRITAHRSNGRSPRSMKSSMSRTSSLSRGQFGELLPGFGERSPADVQRAVRALDRGDAVGVEAAALQAFGIDAARPALFAFRPPSRTAARRR